MTVLWPAVVSWLSSTLPAVAGWGAVAVFDGKAYGDTQLVDFMQVGWVDSDDTGSWNSQLDETGLSNTETGTVKSTLTCNVTSGTDTVAAVRTRLFALVNALDGKLRVDQTLDGALATNGLVEISAGDVTPVQNQWGTGLQLVLTVQYTSFSWRN